MADSEVSLDANVAAIVKVLDAVHYNDTNYPIRAARVDALRALWAPVATHFEHQLKSGELRINLKILQGAIRTCAKFVVFCYPKLPLSARIDLAIFLTYFCFFEDDTAHDSAPTPAIGMGSFFQDLLAGKEQRQPFWRSIQSHMPKFFEHYGSFCQLAIYRGALDWYQGTWMESLNIK